MSQVYLQQGNVDLLLIEVRNPPLSLAFFSSEANLIYQAIEKCTSRPT